MFYYSKIKIVPPKAFNMEYLYSLFLGIQGWKDPSSSPWASLVREKTDNWLCYKVSSSTTEGGVFPIVTERESLHKESTAWAESWKMIVLLG